MAPITVKVNTYVGKKLNTMDRVTKILVALGAAVGLNRIQLLGSYSKTIYVLVIVWSIVLILGVYAHAALHHMDILNLSLIFFQYISSIIMCYVARKQVHLYFLYLNQFNAKVRCCPKTSHILKLNNVLYVTMAIVTVSSVVFFYCVTIFLAPIAPFHFAHLFEQFWFAHLLSLLYPRLKLICHCMELSLSNCNNLDLATFQRGFESYDSAVFGNLSKNVDKLVELYNIVSMAYVNLIQSAKWQFLVLLTTSLVTNISVLFSFISGLLQATNEDGPVDLALHALLVITNMLSLCCPCLAGEQLKNELNILKRLLASRIYEDKMDKRNRVCARALLSLTQEQSLTVSILGMVQLDISLPLHYVSLLVTYLIILLQFNKVVFTPD